ncbi:MAG TPA: biliverdin-producing heme oxygenase [Ramlibacter sp.]
MKTTAPVEPPGPAPEDVLTALRAATRTRHDGIDALLDLGRMSDAAHYARILQVFDAFLGPWEAAVAAALPADFGPWLAGRSRRALLATDLRALALPRLPASAVPILPTPAAAWGSLYVMEGSALGGQVITRALAADGTTSAHPCAFFHGWGAATGGMWREFRGLLAGQVVRPADVAAACTAASATFDALTDSFETHLHERAATA